jgi:SAM-dependent methyltransferase
VDLSNNTLIRKHGVKWFFDTIKGKVDHFEPVSQLADVEGDYIRYVIGSKKPDSKSCTGLDIGCGGNKTVEQALGIDETPKSQPGVAGGISVQTGKRSIIEGDASDLPVESDSQDYLIARHVIEHLLSPFKALDEWMRVLRPGGILCVACPDQDVCDTMALDFSHVHAYNPETLREILESKGFIVDEIKLIRPGWAFVIKAVKPIGPSLFVQTAKEVTHESRI